MIKFSKRKMQSASHTKNVLGQGRFIFGNIKYRVLENKGKTVITDKTDTLEYLREKYETKLNWQLNQIELYAKKPANEQEDIIRNTMKLNLTQIEKQIQFVKNANKESCLFNPTKQEHGYCGVLTDEYVYLVFQTSSPASKILGLAHSRNIPVEEALNPIKYVNTPQKVPLKMF